MVADLITLLMLILLQVVLGLDNLLYISLESQNAPKEKQKMVRYVGISIAIIFRIGLLFLLLHLIQFFQDPIFSFGNNKIITGEFNIHSLIVYFGGGFILYTAVKEIWHMISFQYSTSNNPVKEKEESVNKVIIMIVIMNVVFSFDSILSAMALTHVFWIMAIAIVVGGVLMIFLSEIISKFLQKNKQYQVLGLFILFLVGVMLLSEAAHISDLYVFGNEIHPMQKSTFYFVLAILVLVDVVQSRYQRKLLKKDATLNQSIADNKPNNTENSQKPQSSEE